MADDSDILFGQEGGLATVMLNRPRALNALTLGMYQQFDPKLREWVDDSTVHAVLIQGAGERAFCAGGDVRAVYEAGRGIGGNPALTSVFFWEEYELIHRLHHYPKPYVAIIDGITMGGGVGVSVNGAYRVATERTMLAMPETGIGLFPDVGATHFLNRAPGHIGRYLGLSGARVHAADALYCGFATHFVPSDRVPAFVDALGAIPWRVGDHRREVEALLARYHVDPGPAPLREQQAAIDRCFGHDTIDAILHALSGEAADGAPHAEWAGQTRAGLLTKSPTSLKVTLRQLIVGQQFDLEQALILEYRLTQHFMKGHDFFEGVRAVLVDRDNQPRWQPATLAEVDEVIVEGYFLPLGERELRFS